MTPETVRTSGWRRSAWVVSVAVSIAFAAPARSFAETDTQRAVGWLGEAQNEDGGYGSAPGFPSSPAMTGWVMLALEAARVSPAAREPGRPSALAYLRAHAGRLRTPGDLERTILALEGASIDAHSFAGRDLVAELRRRRSANGSFAEDVNLTAYGILALDAAGERTPRGSATWLRRAQNEDGGWGFRAGAPSEADSAGAVLEALGAANARRKAMRNGVRYLRRSQHASGGWRCAVCPGANAQSTALAVQGLIASGVRPESVRNGGRSGLDYLRARQTSAGWFRYSAESDQSAVWTTARVVPAVEGQALPVDTVPRPVARRQPGSGEQRAGERLQELPPRVHGDGDTRGIAVQRGNHSAADSRHAKPSVQEAEPPAPRARQRVSGAPRESVAARTLEPQRETPGAATGRWVATGFGALSVALILGFLWYRRRLP